MKLNNTIIICLFVISLAIAITCTGNIKISLEDVVTFNYPVPDGMITDASEKEAMIQAKIKQLEAINNAYWGELPNKRDKIIETIEELLTYIRTTFPGFKGLDLDWDKVEKEILEKTKNAKNSGELYSLISKAIFSLKEGHTGLSIRNKKNSKIIDKSYFTFSTLSTISSIGACVVVNDKEEIITTRVVDENNTYNIKPGDEIVGYNGISWKEWYPYLLESIPINSCAGASEGVIRYNLIKSAVANANLFEKINIKRYDTGKIDTIPIKEIKQDFFDWSKNCTEYISNIENIYTPSKLIFNYLLEDEKLGFSVNDIISSGVIEKYNIGYIYITQFTSGYNEFSNIKDWNPYETEFSKCLEKKILDLKNTNGMIIDLRANGGGRTEVAYKAISHLIKSKKDLSIFQIFKRNDKDSSLYSLLKEDKEQFNITFLSDNPDLYYEKPIIILTGPDCISGCDLAIALFSKFPEFKIIGNHNNGSFSFIERDLFNMREYKIENNSISLFLPHLVVFFTDDENPYLLRRSDFVDEFVFPTKDDIAKGIDTVREHAIKLIQEANKN